MAHGLAIIYDPKRASNVAWWASDASAPLRALLARTDTRYARCQARGGCVASGRLTTTPRFVARSGGRGRPPSESYERLRLCRFCRVPLLDEGSRREGARAQQRRRNSGQSSARRSAPRRATIKDRTDH
jgi:hypothetical protein